MKFQTEHLENHTARFTVELDVERFETAKQKAARKIAKQVNIPGFRKGKVPYSVLVRNGLEGHIVNEAIEELTQDVYREALEQSDVEPYGPGSFDDVQFAEEAVAPTFIFSVPLQPVVKLGDYRAIRKDYEQPEVTEDMVDEAMENLREREAVVEPSEEPAEVGNRVSLDIHATFADDAPETDDEAAAQPEKGAMFLHEHDAAYTLNPENEPVLPGFIDEIVGAKAEDELDFELTIPADDEEYEDIAGRKIAFNMVVNKVEKITLPELDDEFAQRVTAEDEEGPFNLEQLREKMQESLKEQLEARAKDAYASEVIDEIVEMSEFSYPEAMIEDQIEDMIKDLGQRLQQQGISLDVFYNITGKSEDELKVEYREPAENSIKRSLILREVLGNESITITEEEINARLDEMVAQFGEQAEQIRAMFDTPRMRESILNDMLQAALIDRIVAIAKGEEIQAEPEETSEEEASPETDTAE